MYIFTYRILKYKWYIYYVYIFPSENAEMCRTLSLFSILKKSSKNITQKMRENYMKNKMICLEHFTS